MAERSGPARPSRRPSLLPQRRLIALKPALERLYHQGDAASATVDPVQVVHRYPNPADREVVGFLAAGLAFGRVASIMGSLERLLGCLGLAPSSFIRSFEPVVDGTAIRGLGHRWIRGADLVAVLWLLRRILETHGSIEGFFVAGDDPHASDVGPGLDAFSRRALELGAQTAGALPGATLPTGARYFFPRPSSGSGCKRLNLFMRWMVRCDTVDLGVWSRVSTSRLVVPLDVHVIRVARCLRLTRYRTPGWQMAAEITAALRTVDPLDPVRYDFSLCHLGMQGFCGFNREQRDGRCPLRGICRPGARRAARSVRPSAVR